MNSTKYKPYGLDHSSKISVKPIEEHYTAVMQQYMEKKNPSKKSTR